MKKILHRIKIQDTIIVHSYFISIHKDWRMVLDKNVHRSSPSRVRIEGGLRQISLYCVPSRFLARHFRSPNPTSSAVGGLIFYRVVIGVVWSSPRYSRGSDWNGVFPRATSGSDELAIKARRDAQRRRGWVNHFSPVAGREIEFVAKRAEAGEKQYRTDRMDHSRARVRSAEEACFSLPAKTPRVSETTVRFGLSGFVGLSPRKPEVSRVRRGRLTMIDRKRKAQSR